MGVPLQVVFLLFSSCFVPSLSWECAVFSPRDVVGGAACRRGACRYSSTLEGCSSAFNAGGGRIAYHVWANGGQGMWGELSEFRWGQRREYVQESGYSRQYAC